MIDMSRIEADYADAAHAGDFDWFSCATWLAGAIVSAGFWTMIVATAT